MLLYHSNRNSDANVGAGNPPQLLIFYLDRGITEIYSSLFLVIVRCLSATGSEVVRGRLYHITALGRQGSIPISETASRCGSA